MSLSLGPGEPEVLNFKRRKVCKEKEKGQPAEGLVSSPSAPATDNQAGRPAAVVADVVVGVAAVVTVVFAVAVVAAFMLLFLKMSLSFCCCCVVTVVVAAVVAAFLLLILTNPACPAVGATGQRESHHVCGDGRRVGQRAARGRPAGRHLPSPRAQAQPPAQ